ncbi:MAG: hypothetical protein QM790_04695 [Nibricoccus sp.]
MVLGAAKAALYLIGSPPWFALVMGIVFAVLAGTLRHLFNRLKNKPNVKDPAKMYKAAGVGTGKFYWEYVPMTLIVMTMFFGEWLLSSVTITVD